MKTTIRLFSLLLVLTFAVSSLAEDCLCTQIQIPIEDCVPDGGVAPTESSPGRNPNYSCPYCGRLLYPGEEIPPLASNQEAIAEPAPAPQPQPEPEPAPQPAPDPEPAPAPAPQPEPVIQPAPEPAPVPAQTQESPVVWAAEPEPAASAIQENPVAPASQSEPVSSGQALPPVPSAQQPTASDLAYVEAKRQEEAAEGTNTDPAGTGVSGASAAPRRKALSLFFPYRHYLLKPASGFTCPHAGVLLWSSIIQNEPGGLFASYAN